MNTAHIGHKGRGCVGSRLAGRSGREAKPAAAPGLGGSCGAQPRTHLRHEALDLPFPSLDRARAAEESSVSHWPLPESLIEPPITMNSSQDDRPPKRTSVTTDAGANRDRDGRRLAHPPKRLIDVSVWSVLCRPSGLIVPEDRDKGPAEALSGGQACGGCRRSRRRSRNRLSECDAVAMWQPPAGHSNAPERSFRLAGIGRLPVPPSRPAGRPRGRSCRPPFGVGGRRCPPREEPQKSPRWSRSTGPEPRSS